MEKLLGITMGCPVGIGPEIILRFFATRSKVHGYAPVVLGDIGVLQHTASTLGLPGIIVPWEPGMPAQQGTIPVFNLSSLPVQDLAWGRPDAMTGRAMAGYIETAVRLTLQGQLAGIVTCPITKKALHLAGYPYPGHTEMLAELSGAKQCLMMMAGSRLRVALVTIHEAMRRVPDLITMESVTACIRLTARALREDFALAYPRIAVASLNPHAGEQGMFGREEQDIIGPAVNECAGVGAVSGPWPPDTVFHRAAAGEFDAVVAMYHDQGLIPFKLLHFKDGVNVTLGLPLVRTSVDHGTAYDIAGQGRADCTSLAAAFSLAAEIAGNRTQRGGLMNTANKGILIAIEGIDGTGKSTQVGLLARYLRNRGCEVVETREPTGGPYGRRIRELFVNRGSCTLEEELDLFIEDRRQHVHEVIAPALAQGQVVLTDRYYFSTAAYQGAAGMDPAEVFARNRFAPRPDLVILLTMQPEASLVRIRESRGEELNDFEQEDQLRRVAELFASFDDSCITRIAADGSLENVAGEIQRAVDRLLLDKHYVCPHS